MAIGQVKAKSYDYGSYARPQQVKLGDKTGLAKGIISAVSSIAKGAEDAIAEKKAKEEADKLKAKQEGEVEALREKSLENVATSTETLKFISEAQTNLENMYNSGELSDKEYGRLKAIEQQNYQDTLALGQQLDTIEKIDFDESQFKSPEDYNRALLRNAIANGQYKMFNYDVEKGASIEISYVDANGDEQMEIMSAAKALDYFGDPNKSTPRFKFNYAEDGADLLKMAGEIYNSTGLAEEDIKVKDGYKVLDRDRAAERIASDPELREFVKKNGARIWEDVLGNEEGSFDGSDAQVSAVAMNIGQNAAASRHIKQGYGKVEPPKPGKPLTKDQRLLLANQQFVDLAINQGLLGDMAAKVFGTDNVKKVGDNYVIVTKDEKGKDVETPYSPELLVNDVMNEIDVPVFIDSYRSELERRAKEEEAIKKGTIEEPGVTTDWSQFEV